MMIKDVRGLLLSLILIGTFSLIAIGQETTGKIDITVKDAAGAVVPNAPLTVISTGQTTGYKRSFTTDDSGFARVIGVPPGTYSVIAGAVSGFLEKRVDDITVNLGFTSAVAIEMSTTVTTEVTVTSDAPPIDVTDSAIQTTISAQTAELLPKGLNVDSILKYSPATRSEDRSGGFQIDGASGSENTFIIDGQEVTNIRTGAFEANNRLPFSLVQEVQIKTSGFEAEYGGATGGVVNIVTRGGGDTLRGEFGLSFRSAKLEPIQPPTIRNRGGVVEEYPSRWYPYNETNPSANLAGPIWKGKIWFSISYVPQIFTRERTLIFRNLAREPTGRVDTYNFKQKKEAAFGRIDAQPFSRLHLTATYNWNPVIQEGFTPGFSSELQEVTTTTLSHEIYDLRGGRQNSMNFTVAGVYSLTNTLQISARAGHYFLNEKLGTYGLGNVNVPIYGCANTPLSSQPFPANFGCVRGQTVGTTVDNTEFDATTRDQYDFDATYSFSAFGRHEVKGGYQNNSIANDVNSGNNDQISLRWGTGPLSTVGAISGHAGQIPSAPGASGSGALTIFQTTGSVSSKNEGIYFQDKWQPFRRLTLNLGLRTEREDVPSYSEGLPGMSFSFGSKLAPRLGGAYDLTGDGKTKVSAFYGLFYDRFKLELPRGSFGGDLFHTVYFDLFPTDTLLSINRELVFGGGFPPPGGVCPLGTQTPAYGRVRCDKDFRVPSNSGGPLTQVGGIDPNIKPFQQSELTFTFQRQLSRDYMVAARYTRKKVLHAIEDAGFPNEEGSEYYIIGNPGEGLHKEQADMFGTLALKAQRQYDALELRLERAFANRFFFNVNYTWSRLYGNYGGLASSDEDGRLSPNVNRYFDQPHAGFTATGGPDTGRLPTDRPHVFKFYGAYALGWEQFGLWKSNTTDFEVFTTAQSGNLVTSFVTINTIAQIVLDKRGDQGRTPTYTQTDFAVRHTVRFGKDSRFQLKAEADFLNVFNERNVVQLGANPSGQGGNVINTTDFNVTTAAFNLISPEQAAACATNSSPGQCRLVAAYSTFQRQGSPEILAAARSAVGHNIFYNYPMARQGARQIRYGIRFLF